MKGGHVLLQLNKSQQQAVSHIRGPMLVLAGPGSGKTAVITKRVRELVETHEIPPEKILVITFSRAAAVEMKNRFLKMTDNKYTSVNFGTFHAVFFKIIKSAYQYDNSSIVTDEERYRVLKDCARKFNINASSERELTERLSSAVSEVKSNNIEPVNSSIKLCKPEVFAEIFEAYQGYLEAEGRLDFDDMMIKCLRIFEERPDILHSWQERYEYILIDEFQDINGLQYKLVKQLAAPQNNIFAVGDDDQSIYGFRGAKPDIMFNFERDYKGCRRVLLDVNYRSREEIMGHAMQLVRTNRNRFEKRIMSNRGTGGRCEYRLFKDVHEQNEYLLGEIKSRQEQSVAVLYRTNAEVRELYRILIQHGIKCRLHDQIAPIFDHWIAEDIISYLMLAEDRCDRSSFLRIANRPNRYVTRSSVQSACLTHSEYISLERVIYENRDKKYVTDGLNRLAGHMKFLKRLDVFAGMNYIRYALGYGGYISEYAKEKGLPAEELYDVFEELKESARGCRSVDEWLERINEFKRALKQEAEEKKKDRMVEEDTVVDLMTFHCSKGLEFDVVYIINAMEGFTPQKRAETVEDIEEERRAFYVAMTRARNELHITGSKERYSKTATESRFIREAGLADCNAAN